MDTTVAGTWNSLLQIDILSTISRDNLVARAVAGSSFGNVHYETKSEDIAGLINAGSANIFHGKQAMESVAPKIEENLRNFTGRYCEIVDHQNC